jgi:hypothetical protein
MHMKRMVPKDINIEYICSLCISLVHQYKYISDHFGPTYPKTTETVGISRAKSLCSGPPDEEKEHHMYD